MIRRSIHGTGKFDYSYSIDTLPPNSLDNSHCHDTYELLYIIEGTGTIAVEGSVFDFKPGTMMVIFPYQYHSVFLDEDVRYERFVLHFSIEAMFEDAKKIFKQFIGHSDVSGKVFPPEAVSKSILPLLDRFEDAGRLPDDEREVYIKSLLSELAVFLSVSVGKKIDNAELELGARVIKYLNENIDKDVSLDKLARRFFVSKYYLCRAFKKHNGISVHGYVSQKRVMYAKHLIESGETASGAAYKVGFGDYSAFYRAYVKVVGKAPTAQG